MSEQKIKFWDVDSVMLLPPESFVCPICKGILFITEFAAHQKDDEGLWFATEISIDCENEPDIDSPGWIEWHVGHYAMPYVDWLPLYQRILEWLKKNYRFDLDGKLNKAPAAIKRDLKRSQ